MTPALALSLREFVVAALSLLVILRVIAVAGGAPLLPAQWHEWALPIGMAAMFAAFRHAQRRS